MTGWDAATLPVPLGRGRVSRAYVHHYCPPPPDLDPVCRWRYKRATHWTPPDISVLAGRAIRTTPTALPRGEALLAQRLRVRCSRATVLRQGITVRGRRAFLLAVRLRAAVVREAALGQDLHALVRSGYRLFAVNLATGEETYLGFMPAEGPLALAGVELADGDHEIRVRADGGYWRDARYAKAFPLRIEGGEIVAPLPAVTGLTYSRTAASLMLSWTWRAGGGTQTPRDFAIWTASSQPVDTSGDPDEIVPALAPGGYSTTLPDSTDTLHVALCARRDGRKGPISTIAIPGPETSIASPDNQTAWFERNR